MSIYSYMQIFRGECHQMDLDSDTFARLIAKTDQQFPGSVPRLTAQDREELHKIYLEELSEARIRARENKAAPQ